MAVSNVTSAYGELVDTTLRVATWNLWWRFGPWEARQPAIAATLLALEADVVCLQEVWESDDGTNQAAQLADALGGWHHVYASRLRWDDGRFGNAVLSRWPIVGDEWRSLPAPDDADELRTVLRADIDGPRGPLQVFSTHLNWRFDHSAIRQDQVRTIARFVKESPARRFPPIVCGDFNAAPESDEVRMMTGRAAVPEDRLVFHDAWEAAGDRAADPGYTWRNENPFARLDLEPDRRIDYVFVGWPKTGGVGHAVGCRVFGTEPVGGVVGSDHAGVVADLRY
jgi:endonuclease/exonuclease/phosphatase family metal-dependent hydrolase